MYGFSGSASDFAMRWQHWCAEASDGDLFMSHASGAVEAGSDPIMAAREAELRALLDTSTWRVLDERGLAIVRLSQRAEHAVETVG